LQIKNAVCSKRHSLVDDEIKIDGMPTIKLKITSDDNEGFFNIDPIYGKNRNQYSIKLQAAIKVQLSCPKCNVSLVEKDALCPKCKSIVYSFEVPPQGMFEGCVNPDCDWQQWSSIDEAGVRDYIEIKVVDNGRGISKEDLQKIFDPFFSTKGQKGTGLGLAVVWGILDNHDGIINVKSEVGNGTTFTILFPASQN
jgi:signal transduction histidine kinase